jgi:hypothetical protein
MSNKIEEINKNIPTNESLRLDEGSAEFSQTFKEITAILLKLFLKIERKGCNQLIL